MVHTQQDGNIRNWTKSVKGMLCKAGLALTLCTAPLLFIDGQAQAATISTDVSIGINGQLYHFQDPPFILNDSTFIPLRAVSETLGAEVWWDDTTRTVGIESPATSIAFVVGRTTAMVNQHHMDIPAATIVAGKTMVPLRFVSEALGMEVEWDHDSRTVWITDPNAVTAFSASTVTQQQYTVHKGDTLWLIGQRFGLSVEDLKRMNSLSGDLIHVGQKLALDDRSAVIQQNEQQSNVSYTYHAVERGENAWSISNRYGVPVCELLQTNHLTEQHSLQVGDILKVPVYDIPVKPTVSDAHGEVLDWWSEAQYVFSIGTVATVIDFDTGRSFQVKRTMGANHADTEPLTAEDARIMREIWGGSYSWTPRAVIVEVDGRRLAAAMHSMPHGDQKITNNQYNGHFCIHFLNSVRHRDGQPWTDMQRQIQRAAGLR
jgi:LysM repeat protein